MTKGERRKAIALALEHKEATAKACDEAYTRMTEACNRIPRFDMNTIELGDYMRAKRHYEECKSAYFDACHEYSELTKYKAWKNL